MLTQETFEMKLSSSLTILALVSGAFGAPDRLLFKAADTSGISSSNQLGHSHKVETYDKTVASGSSSFYSMKPRAKLQQNSFARNGNAPLDSSNKQIKQYTSSQPTKTVRLRSNPERTASSARARRHLRVKYRHETDKRSGTPVSRTGFKVKWVTKVGAHKRQASNNVAPTPAPTGAASTLTTVHITNESDFALLLPEKPNGNSRLQLYYYELLLICVSEAISDAEAYGIAFCTASGCENTLQQGFITAASVNMAPDNSSWIQAGTCLC